MQSTPVAPVEDERSPGSLLAALRSGAWRRFDVGRLWMVALLAACTDVATTYHILATPAYVEFNAAIAGLAATGVWAAMAYFVLWNAGLLAVGALDLGWLSTSASVFQVAVVGTTGVNNLVLFATGTAPVQVLHGPLLVNHGIPLAGVLLALGVPLARRSAPLRELLLVGGVATTAMTAEVVLSQGVVLW